MTDNDNETLAERIALTIPDHDPNVNPPSRFDVADAILAMPEMQAIRHWITNRRFDYDWYTSEVTDDLLPDLPPSIVAWVLGLPCTEGSKGS